MRKILCLISSVALIFTSCSKESGKVEEGGESVVSINVGIPTLMTKAAADNDGNAVKANHWIMEVRDAQGQLFYRTVKTPAEGTLQQTFTVSLIKNQSYNLLFWADNNGGYYNTDDLTNVTLSDAGTYAGNADARDAYTACKSYQAKADEQIAVTMCRPFAQLNIITKDLSTLWEQAATTVSQSETYLKFEPKNYIAKLKVPTSYNVMTQKCGEISAAGVTVTADETYTGYTSDNTTVQTANNYKLHTNPATLFMDYVFASKDQQDVLDIAFEFVSNGQKVEYDFTSIPVQANFRTNISGKILSYDTEWTVDIKPAWFGEYGVDFYQTSADGIQDLNNILSSATAQGAGEVSASVDLEGSTTNNVEFTSGNEGQVVSLTFEGDAPENPITFSNAQGTDGPGTLKINAPAGTKLQFNTPLSHVIINGTSYENISGSFSANSLVISEGTTVNNLTVAAGGVEIHGTVNNVTVTGTKNTVFVHSCEGLSESVYNALKPYIADGYVASANGNTWDILSEWTSCAAESFQSASGKNITIYTAEELALFAKKLKEGYTNYSGYTVKLGADIDLAGNIWKPIAAVPTLTFDGANHTISNMTIIADNNYGNAFISTCYGATIKNVTFDKANVSKNKKDFYGNIYAVVTAYAGYYTDATFENVTVKNSKVSAYGKVGAIAGMAEMQGNTLTFKNCKVESTTLKGVYNVGGLIGNFQYQVSGSRNQIVIENSTVDYTFETSQFPDRNFASTTTIEGLEGTYLCDDDGYYYATNAKYYCEFNSPEANSKNADAIIHNNPDSIIISE